jgi:hypothetical protein
LKRLIWLHAGIYTHDIEAMALNNIGACHLGPGVFDRVSEPLQMALTIDPEPWISRLLAGRADTAWVWGPGWARRP